jgi:gamma-glutamylcyclotransferase (GGCT)/AIG2-like uncharacterized protein YtfP
MQLREVLDLVAHANAARRDGTGDSHDESPEERALEAVFACSEHLAVYGSLAPGRENHHLLAGCPGTWTQGTVTGRVAQRTWRAFTFDPTGAPVDVHVLRSAQLRAHWRALDTFEGADYRRELVPVTGGDGRLLVANLYAAVTPVS